MSTSSVSGADFKAWYADPEVFPEGSYWDDVLVLVDGKVYIGDEISAQRPDGEVEDIADDAKVEVEGGFIASESGLETKDIRDSLSEWMTRRAFSRVVVMVPRGDMDAFLRAVQATGARIVTGPGSDAQTPGGAHEPQA